MLSLATSVAVACAHGKGNVELSAQAGEPTEPPAEAAPAASSTAVAEAPAQPPASASGTAPTQTTPLYDFPACPLECRILRPHVRALTPDEKERIRSALAPTINGLKACIYGAEPPSVYVRPPPVTLRFNDQGDLVDLGVDSEGFDTNLEGCFQSLAHGQSAMPVVKLDSGAATVLCDEVCPRPARPKAAKKK